jgi:hypothetical protein
MRRLAVALLVAASISIAACESKQPEPYFLVTPSSIAPSISSSLTRWDSGRELHEWVDNAWTEGQFSIRSEGGVEFAHVDLRPGVSAALYSPNFEPVFTGLRGVRIRLRYAPEPETPTAGVNRAFASVAATIRPAPSNPLNAGYIATPAAVPGVWQIVELGPDGAPYYPPVIDARWMYLALGRTGDVSADIDFIELLR